MDLITETKKPGDKKMGLGSSVWEREHNTHYGDMALDAYTAAVSVFTTSGIIIAATLGYLTMNMDLGWGFILLAGLATPMVGIFIAIASDNWRVSLIGYLLVCIGLGAITGPTVAFFETTIMVKALLATAGVTAVMSLAGIIYPKSLEHWSLYLLAGLLALIFVRLGQMMFITPEANSSRWYSPIIEYGAALLFSLYIMYDWNRSRRLPRNLDNAVDCALAIFLDIINLFITLLRMVAKKN